MVSQREHMHNNNCPASNPFSLLEETYECNGNLKNIDMTKCKPIKGSLKHFPYVCTNLPKEEMHIDHNEKTNKSTFVLTHRKPYNQEMNFDRLAQLHLCKMKTPTAEESNEFDESVYKKIPECSNTTTEGTTTEGTTTEGFISAIDLSKVDCSKVNCVNKYNQWYTKNGKQYGVPLCGSKPFEGGDLEKTLQQAPLPLYVSKHSKVSDSAASAVSTSLGTSVCYPVTGTFAHSSLLPTMQTMTAPGKSLVAYGLVSNNDVQQCNMSFFCWLFKKL